MYLLLIICLFVFTKFTNSGNNFSIIFIVFLLDNSVSKNIIITNYTLTINGLRLIILKFIVNYVWIMIRFEHFEFLYFLSGIPVLFIIYYLYRRWRRNKLKIIGDYNLINQLIPNSSGSKAFFKFIFLMFAYLFFVVGIANPQIGTKLEEIKRKGVEVIIALDISNSMTCEDIKPNRLDRSKQEISKLIDGLENDKIGIIIFAGKSFMQLPLTTDYSAARLMLSTINTDLISSQGTAMGSAIDMAVESFSSDNTKSKVLIIISDGENHEDNALESSKKAADKNIIIHAIGMGTMEGGPIPIYQNGRISGFMKDNEGNTILTKLNPNILQEVAIAGSGEFSTPEQMDLKAIIDKITNMEKQEFGTKTFTDYESRFQIFIAIGLLFLLIEFFMTERKFRSFNRLSNLIGGKK